MSGPHSRFYVTGGTLARDAACYVVRDADRSLYEALSQDKFCYVLTSRQMGKSSLMVRTALRLRAEGTAAVALDLTAIGQNVTVDQWYDGLLAALGRQLGIERELEEHWARRSALGPFQRWTSALSEVVLPRHPGDLVIFVDEIDAVRSLSFSTDEFFAGIRELHNRRAVEPALSRLTFCLLGVATPSNLVSDPLSTPFNIGERIEIADFTEGEAVALAPGLRRSEPESSALLSRILYWTAGHPYLTQRLCQAVAEDEATHDLRGVDRVCERLFLTPSSREQDDNLAFVQDRVLHIEKDPVTLLTLYGKVRAGECVHDDETSPLVSALHLAGIVRGENGRLLVRNRIYRTVFDRKWVKEQMPDAEVRRQRAAYRKGLLRAATIAVAVLGVVAGLATLAVLQRNRAVRDEQTNRQLLYAAQINLAHQALVAEDPRRAEALLKAHVPRAGQEDLRGFEWYYLWRLCCQERGGLRHGAVPPTVSLGVTIWTVTFSPDGRTLASGGDDTTVRLWNVATKTERATLRGHGDTVKTVIFSPDGKTLASGATDGTLKLWDVTTRRELANVTGEPIDAMALSRDGKTLAVGRRYRSIHLLDLNTSKETGRLELSAGAVISMAISPDSKTLAIGNTTSAVEIWDLSTRRVVAALKGHFDQIWSLAFSPDGKFLATGSNDGTLKIWDVATERAVKTLQWRTSAVLSVAFSPDGKLLAAGINDRTLRLIALATGRELASLRGHFDFIRSISFSPDGRILATGAGDNSIKLWATDTGRELGPANASAPSDTSSESRVPTEGSEELSSIGQPHYSLAFSPDGRALATADQDGRVRIWDVGASKLRQSLEGHRGPVRSVVFSPRSRLMATGGDDGVALLRDSTTGEIRARLQGHREGVCAVQFSPDGNALATTGQDGRLVVWDVPTASPRIQVTAGPARVCSVAFSPDGKVLATGGLEDRALTLWDVASGRAVSSVDGESVGWVNALEFSPDGKFLATASRDRTARLWDLSLSAARVLQHGTATPWSLAISADGKTLATATGGGRLYLWDVRTAQELFTLEAHPGSIFHVAFSPDGSILASAGRDGSVKLWRAATEDAVRASLARREIRPK